MKKGLIILSSIIVLGLATGCGSKKKVLECTKTEDQSGVKLKSTITANFKGNNVEDMVVNMDAILGDSYKNYKSTYVKAFESSFSSYKDLKGVNVKISETDDGVNIKLTADLDKMDDDAKDALDIVNTKANYDQSKKDLEDDGYTCKK